MKNKVEIIQGMSVIKFDGVRYIYKGHTVEVTVCVEFDPGPCSNFDLRIDGVHIDITEIFYTEDGNEYSFEDAWYGYGYEGDRQIHTSGFQELLKDIVKQYLKQQETV